MILKVQRQEARFLATVAHSSARMLQSTQPLHMPATGGAIPCNCCEFQLQNAAIYATVAHSSHSRLESWQLLRIPWPQSGYDARRGYPHERMRINIFSRTEVRREEKSEKLMSCIFPCKSLLPVIIFPFTQTPPSNFNSTNLPSIIP
mgnify:CR=1 FL=1